MLEKLETFVAKIDEPCNENFGKGMNAHINIGGVNINNHVMVHVSCLFRWGIDVICHQVENLVTKVLTVTLP